MTADLETPWGDTMPFVCLGAGKFSPRLPNARSVIAQRGARGQSLSPPAFVEVKPRFS